VRRRNLFTVTRVLPATHRKLSVMRAVQEGVTAHGGSWSASATLLETPFVTLRSSHLPHFRSGRHWLGFGNHQVTIRLAPLLR